MGDAAGMLKWMSENAVPLAAYEKLSDEQKGEKFPTGILYQKEAPEYSAEYAKVIKLAQEGK